MRRSCLVAVAAVVISVILPVRSFAQTPSLSTLSATTPESVVVSSSVAPAPDSTFEQGGARSSSGAPGAGIGVKLGTLGVGIQGAVAVNDRVNVRGGFNFFSINRSLDQSGTAVDASVKLQSVEANLDLLIGGGFRFSPGVLLYNNNHLDLAITAPTTGTFSIGGQNYTSLVTDPVQANGTMSFNKFSPMLAIGFGQLVPRDGRHFSVALDLGVVFEAAPTVSLTYGGTGCISPIPPGVSQACRPINTQPNITTAISDEQTKFSDAVNILKYYPVLSLGFGWRF
jgi:hypothetical protein